VSRSQNGNRGTTVEDAKREAQVVRAAVASAKEKGLNEQFISTFFSAQIEAHKLVQYSLLAEWRRRGRAPAHKPIDLSDIRQKLDQLQEQLIQGLAHTRAARETATCQADVAKAVGRYVARRPRYSLARAIALDRALATFCTPE
jgi:chorismate mutase